jgi:hypothetical protein
LKLSAFRNLHKEIEHESEEGKQARYQQAAGCCRYCVKD